MIYDNSIQAIEQRKTFLTNRGIGICDIVDSAERQKIDASDLGMQNAKLRNILGHLKQNSKIDTLLFTGGNSNNGPEYFFRQHLKEYNLKLELVNNEVPRIHKFNLTESSSGVEASKRTIKTVSLTAPSGAANRAVGSMDLYKQLKANNPNFNTFDFRVMQYRDFF